MRTVSSKSCGVVVKTIAILGLQESWALTGAPTWAAMSFTLLVTNFAASGRSPAVMGHTATFHRASFSATRVGTVIAPTNLLTAASTSLIPVTVILSVGAAGFVSVPCAMANTGLHSVSARAAGKMHLRIFA